MVAGVTFRQKSVFLSSLATLGLQYPPDPARAHLQRAGVASIMNRSLARLAETCTAADARQALASAPRWIVVETEPGRVRCVLNAIDLRAHLEEEGPADDAEVSLLRIPGVRRDAGDIDYRATVDEAYAKLRSPDVEALCVRRTSAPMIASVRGVIVQEDIDNYRESAP
jgi:hypothetical protein